MESPPLPPDSGAPVQGGMSKDEQNLAMLAHLLALSGLVVPLGNVLGPLILWLIKKDSMPFVDQQGKEAINFNITVSIAAAVCLLTFFLILPMLLLVAVGIVWLVLTIIAAMKVSEGKAYTYPWSLRLVK